jgi:hypothetical protein
MRLISVGLIPMPVCPCEPHAEFEDIAHRGSRSMAAVDAALEPR